MLVFIWLLGAAQAAPCSWWMPCYEADKTAPDATDTASNRPVVYYRAVLLPLRGHAGFCSEDEPCAVDEGDCNSDSECDGELVCRHDAGEIYGFAPLTDVCVPRSLRCPEDYFHSDDQADEVRLAFPLKQDADETHVSTGMWNVYKHLPAVPVWQSHAWWARTYPGHGGTDFMITPAGIEAGVPVVAAADGVITSVDDTNPDRCGLDIFGRVVCDGPDPHTLTNNHVRMCHADGLTTSYLHVAKGSVQVSEGDAVQCGDPLALASSSGNSASDHLHFGVGRASGNPKMPHVLDPYSDDLWVDDSDAQSGWPSSTCD